MDRKIPEKIVEECDSMFLDPTYPFIFIYISEIIEFVMEFTRTNSVMQLISFVYKFEFDFRTNLRMNNLRDAPTGMMFRNIELERLKGRGQESYVNIARRFSPP